MTDEIRAIRTLQSADPPAACNRLSWRAADHRGPFSFYRDADSLACVACNTGGIRE